VVGAAQAGGRRRTAAGGFARPTGRGPGRLVTRPRVALTGAVAALAAGVTTAAPVIPAGPGGVAVGHPAAMQLEAAVVLHRAARIPGVQVVKHPTGPGGQHGIGVMLTAIFPAQVRHGVGRMVEEEMELLFNARTYQYIGNEWGSHHSWIPTQATALVTAGFAGSAPAHSPGFHWLPLDLCPGALS
jgi:hypothetical protein